MTLDLYSMRKSSKITSSDSPRLLARNVGKCLKQEPLSIARCFTYILHTFPVQSFLGLS